MRVGLPCGAEGLVVTLVLSWQPRQKAELLSLEELVEAKWSYLEELEEAK